MRCGAPLDVRSREAALVVSGNDQMAFERIRDLVRQAHDAIQMAETMEEAVLMVRRAHAVERTVNEALKVCQTMTEKQFDLRQQMAEVHLRTQRRAGELLRRLPKHRGGRPRTSSERDDRPQPSTLRELGIDVHESHRWQRIAAVPDARFEEFLVESRERRRELTTAAMLAVARQLIRDELEIADTGERPSGPPALLREYEVGKRHAMELIWLDPRALAAGIGGARAIAEIEDLQRLETWMMELVQHLAAVDGRRGDAA